MEKGISYLNRNFEDYKEALIEFSKKYYPELATSFDDASVGSWQIDLTADVADNLSYHIDRVYQETNIDSAQERASLYAIARNNGVKIPGPKGAMAEMRIKFVLPVSNNGPDYNYAPIVKRGTKFSASSQIFELLSDVDFKSQFNEEGVSDRTIVPNTNSNGVIIGYTVSKLAVVTAGETRIFRQAIHQSDIEPFMEVIIPIEGIMNVESILVVDGTDTSMMPPSYGDFYSRGCTHKTRFYEVDNLAQHWAWLDKFPDETYFENNGKPVRYKYGYNQNGVSTNIVSYCITRGEWRPVQNKFITEYTDNGYLKIIFGAGENGTNVTLGSDMSSFAKWQMSKILNNHNLGTLPKPDSTLFVLYRIGGGKASNVARGAINKVALLNAEFRGNDQNIISSIYKSMSVENTTPSVSGKDMPTEKELKYLIKYNRASQERCVTVKDYIDRILRLPPKYGTPFRVGVLEENNKIMVYLLGIDNKGKLDDNLPTALVKNIEDYLSGYRMINDFVEIKSGRIINLSFDVNVIIDKNYNKSDVVTNIINTISNYMDINGRFMGEEIYVSDIEKEVSKVDGVINLIDLRVYNEHGAGYSDSQISQEVIPSNAFDDDENGHYLGDGVADLIDTEATDGILYNDGDSMMEIKYIDRDIRVRMKEK